MMQVERELQTQLIALDFQTSKAQLEVYQWKRRSAMLQLKLDSQQEDTNHLQEFWNVLSKELQRQRQELTDASSCCQDLQV